MDVWLYDLGAPEGAQRVAPEARWYDGAVGAPTPSLEPGARALLALPKETRVVHCTAESGWAIASAARNGGLDARVVMHARPADALLTSKVQTGDDFRTVLHGEALLAGLRDAHELRGDLPGIVTAIPEEPRSSPEAVTAVVAHRDLGRWLPACLDSLRAQTVPVEIIVVDDASDDRSALDAEERKDPELRVLRLDERGGVGNARLAGVRAARTPLVLIVDADNVFRPRLVERLREALARRSWASAATAGFRVFDDATGETVRHYSPAEISPRALFIANVCGDATALHRREALLETGYHDDFFVSEDWELWLRYAERGLRIVPVHETLFDYRQRPDSKLRARPPLKEAQLRFRFLALHAELAARYADELVVLAGAEWSAWREQTEGARAQAAGLREELRSLRAELPERERALRAESAAALRKLREETGDLLAAMRADGEAQKRVSAGTQAELRAELQVVRGELQMLRQALRATEAERESFRAALLEMASSSAVRLSRAVRELSTPAHETIAKTLRRVLDLARR